MALLPIVERELRVSSRRSATYLVRVAGAAFTLATLTPLLFQLERMPIATIGMLLFERLSLMSLVYCLVFGGWATADSLSSEKREGTLGLLFLTPLKGYDVVLGKLVGTSLRLFYVLLAIVPILGVAIMLGGVTGAEYGRMTIVLASTLLWTASIGLFVSIWNVDEQKSVLRVLGLIAILCGIPFLIDLVILGLGYEFRLRYLGPVYAFTFVQNTHYVTFPESFWIGIGALNLASLLFLWAGSCAVVKRSREGISITKISDETSRKQKKSTPKRDSKQRTLLEQAPVQWLDQRYWKAGVFGGLVVLGIVVVVIVAVLSSLSPMRSLMFVPAILQIILALVIILQSSRFLMESRRSGILELLLSTPISQKEIVTSLRKRSARYLIGASILVLVTQAFPFFSSINSNITGNINLGTGVNLPYWKFLIIQTVLGTIVSLMNLYALSWVAMWYSVRFTKLSTVTLRTYVFVNVIPWVILAICMPIIAGFGGPYFDVFGTPIMWCLKDICFLILAKQALSSDLRNELLLKESLESQKGNSWWAKLRRGAVPA